MVHSGGALCDSAKDAFIGMEEVIRPRAVIAIGPDKRSSVHPITLRFRISA